MTPTLTASAQGGKPLTYGSVCSGIEAATQGWHGLGWKPVFFAEIDSAASAVLKHRHPNVPNHGDFTTIQQGDYEPIDVLVGGTPCQDFSIAGLRAGMGGERGNLTLEFLRLADRLRPEWLVWENVPGVLSSHSHISPDPCPPDNPLDMECDGQEVDVVDEYDSEELHAFNSFLAGLSELGYGWAYVVRDGQYFGVPQRRRRVFVVGHLGDWRRAASVLFEFHSLSGHSAPSRETGQVAPTIPARSLGGGGLGTDFDCDGGLDESGYIETVGALQTHSTPNGHGCAGVNSQQVAAGHVIPVAIQAGALRENADSGPDGVGVRTDGLAYTLEARSEVQAICFSSKDHGADAGDISPTLRSMSHDGSHANGGGQVAVVIPIQNQATRHAGTDGSGRQNGKGHGLGVGDPGDPMYTMTGGDQHAVFAMNLRGRDGGAMPELDELAILRAASGGSSRSYVGGNMAVRRLTPRECERLMGQEDDYTLVPYRGKMMTDGPRYKMLGNSMITFCMSWIGNRIQMVEDMKIGKD